MDTEATEPGLDPTQPPPGGVLEDTGPTPPQTGSENQEGVQHTTLQQPPSTGPPSTDQPLPGTCRQETLTTFLRAPRLPGTSSLFMGDIAFLLHLLLDTPDRLAALSCLAQPLPPSEAATVWAGWKTHLAHEGETFPNGT